MKLDKYLTDGVFDKRVSSMEADLAKKYKSGIRQGKGKLVDKIYSNLMKIADYKKLSMDRQGEIAVKVLDMIQGRM